MTLAALALSNLYKPIIAMHYQSPDLALELYREKFRLMIETNSTSIIGNQSKEHAIVLLQELISHAKKSVYITCTRLSKSIYGNPILLGIIENAIGRGVAFHVSIKDDVAECQHCANLFSDNGIKIKKSNSTMHDFCVIDEKRFRMEINQSTKEARVCAYCPPLAGKMINLFNEFCKDRSQNQCCQQHGL